MRTSSCILAFAAVIWLSLSPANARDQRNNDPVPAPAGPPELRYHTHANDRPLRAAVAAAPSATILDTFVLASFSFDSVGGGPDTQGWTEFDLTGELGTFFHVAGSAELDGGTFGTLLPLEGDKSLWIGVSDQNPLACNYATAPGVGNGWDQRWTSIAFAHDGDVTWSYEVQWDSEAGEDRTSAQFRNSSGEWESLQVGRYEWAYYYDGQGAMHESLVIPDSALADTTQLRFRFTSDGAWSDEDGLWPTDGAALFDSMAVADESGAIDFQDFEVEPDGALVTNNGFWRASASPRYGSFAGLYPGVELLQEDFCRYNLSYIWAFIEGSTATYACGGHPEQAAVPFYSTNGDYWNLYLNNRVESPVIDWAHDMNGQPVPAGAAGAFLEFDIYRDMPIDNLVFGLWYVRGVVNGCPGYWDNDNFLVIGDGKDWHRERFPIEGFINPASTGIQVAVGAIDVCPYYCGIYGTGTCHSHAPLFDNVRVIRVDTQGPRWGGTDPGELFQDNFAADGTTDGTVRIDMAEDILLSSSPAILPGDSACVEVIHPLYGIDNHLTGDPNSGPAVYCHVKDVSPVKSGAAISGDPIRWPAVSTAGGWTTLRCDESVNRWGNTVANEFCVDLNDNLYTPGDTIYYFFSARDGSGATNYWGELTGAVPTEAEAMSLPMEVTCLPANGLATTDILYVDDYDNHGAEPFFQSAFDIIGVTPDRYDVRVPEGMVGNGPGGRVVNVAQQLIDPYRKVIWNTGDLSSGLIGDGTGAPEKSDDFGMLLTFIDQHPRGGGLYVSGDDVAEEWVTLAGAGATVLRSTYMNFNLVGGDHVALGLPLSALAVAESGSCFDHGGIRDTLVAFAGCPGLNDFDVLQAAGGASVEMTYEGNPAHAAVVAQVTANLVGDTARVILSGFSYHQIRDDRVQDPIDRVEHLVDILRWLDNDVPSPTGVGPGAPARNYLAQNTPNPFNPSTRIRYSVQSAGAVTLRVYDVAGRLVRTLVNEIQSPTPDGRVVTWDARNERGGEVASGIYFYRLHAPGFTETRKMLLLR